MSRSYNPVIWITAETTTTKQGAALLRCGQEGSGAERNRKYTSCVFFSASASRFVVQQQLHTAFRTFSFTKDCTDSTLQEVQQLWKGFCWTVQESFMLQNTELQWLRIWIDPSPLLTWGSLQNRGVYTLWFLTNMTRCSFFFLFFVILTSRGRKSRSWWGNCYVKTGTNFFHQCSTMCNVTING